MVVLKKAIKLNQLIHRHLTVSLYQSYRQNHHHSNKITIPSKIPSLNVPDLNIPEFLFRNVERWINKTALVCADTGRSYTFGQTKSKSERFSQTLIGKLGLRKDDIVAILLPNVPEYVIAALGVLQAGLVYTTINPIYTIDEITHQLKECEVKALITLTQNYQSAQQAIRKIPTNASIPIITIKHQKTDTTPSGAIDFNELCEYNGPQIQLERSKPEDLACLPYSSGTSGLPKGVQMLHRNIVADLVQLQHDWVRVNYETTNFHQDVVPVATPLYHAYGMIPVCFNMFSEGCKCILSSKYTPNLFLDILEQYRANILYLVPPIILMLFNNEHATKRHLELVRHIMSAAAPLAGSDVEKLRQKFNRDLIVKQMYGLTETGPVTHAQILSEQTQSGSVGWSLPLVECRIVSTEDETKSLGPTESGHLLMRGPQITPGYYKNETATKEMFTDDGWLRTGDIVKYDEFERFYVTDRMKELIKVKGYQVAPAELEALIRKHPDVLDVAVTGIVHPQHGEVPKAFVVPRQSVNLKSEHIQHYVQQRTAKYKHLVGGVQFVDEIPKNPTGKILRRMLKQT